MSVFVQVDVHHDIDTKQQPRVCKIELCVATQSWNTSEIIAPICRFLFGESALFELANPCAPRWAVAIATLLDLSLCIDIIICPALPTILLVLPTNPVKACAKVAILIHCETPHKLSMHTMATCKGKTPSVTCRKHTSEALTLEQVLTCRQVISCAHQNASSHVCITLSCLWVQRLPLLHLTV